MKELHRLSFGIKAPEEWQPKGFESIQIAIPELMGMWCCMLDKKHLDCFDECPPLNSPKRWLVDKIINFYIFWCKFFRWFFMLTCSTNQSSCHVHLFFINFSKELLRKSLQWAQASWSVLLLFYHLFWRNFINKSDLTPIKGGRKTSLKQKLFCYQLIGKFSTGS